MQEEVWIDAGTHPVAVLLMGIPAGGKSSFYRRYLEPRGLVHINLDTLRTRYREQQLLRECLCGGQSFAVDNTNTLREERAVYIRAAREAGYSVQGFFFRSCVAECLQRNELRENAVPRSAVLAMSARLQLPSMSEGFDSLFYVCLGPDGFEVSPWREE